MYKKIFFSFLISIVNLNGNIFNNKCDIPHSILETIRLTENENENPYIIRTNNKKDIKKFYKILEKYEYKNLRYIKFTKNCKNKKCKTVKVYKDNKYVINCFDKVNCTNILKDLISNGIKNLDLGFFQLNYNTKPLKNFSLYFDEEQSYEKACEVLTNKYLHVKEWDWSTVADYHSRTPSLNKKYQKKLKRNFIKVQKRLNKKKEVFNYVK